MRISKSGVGKREHSALVTLQLILAQWRDFRIAVLAMRHRIQGHALGRI